MRLRLSAGSVVCLALAAPAQAAPAPDGVPAALAEVLSIASFGVVQTQVDQAQLVPAGDAYAIRLPLNGLRSPANAAVTATARPAGDGLWDVTSILFPANGTTGPGPTDEQTYAIGRQDISARIDPDLTRTSTFAVVMGNIHQDIYLKASDQTLRQAIAGYDVDGTISGKAGGRIDLIYGAKLSGWHVASNPPGRAGFTVTARNGGLRLSVADLDRAKGDHLRLAMRGLAGKVTPPEQPANGPAARFDPPPKDVVRDVLENAAGLLTGIEGLETVEDLHVAITPGISFDIGRMLTAVSADTGADRLNAKLDIALDGFSTPSIPADIAPLVPRHVTMRPVLTGVPTGKLLDLLRGAAADAPDEAALDRQTEALFADPNVVAGIDAIGFDSGPLQVTGTARVVAGANKVFTFQLHLAASGMDALLAQVQGQPALQQVLPLLFVAKGMGRQEGSALVWDIVLGDGPPRVNGIPMGQPPGNRR